MSKTDWESNNTWAYLKGTRPAAQMTKIKMDDVLQLLGTITALRICGDFLYVETACEWYEVTKNLTTWRILPEGSD